MYPVAVIGFLGISMACVHGTVEVSGSNHGHVQYKVELKGGICFISASSGSISTPQYSIDIQGYPYNRIVLIAGTVTTDENGIATTTPMALAAGSQFPATITVGSYSKTYATTISTGSGLPAGSYILDAPGLVLDIQVALQNNPGASMSLTVPGSYVNPTLPASSEFKSVVLDQVGSDDLVLNFSADAMAPWKNLNTVPEGRLPHPGIFHPELP